MNKKEEEILKIVLDDILSLNLNLKDKDNVYYLKLIKGNLKDVIGGIYKKKKQKKSKEKWEVYSVYDDMHDAKNCMQDIQEQGSKAKIVTTNTGFAVYQKV